MGGRIKMIEKILTFLLTKYQNRESLKVFGGVRSPLWSKTKREFEKKNSKMCSVCGGEKEVQLHHIKPFHLHPELELEHTNLIWLCEAPNRNCHLNMGHLNSFHSYNVDIKKDAEYYLNKIKNRP